MCFSYYTTTIFYLTHPRTILQKFKLGCTGDNLYRFLNVPSIFETNDTFMLCLELGQLHFTSSHHITNSSTNLDIWQLYLWCYYTNIMSRKRHIYSIKNVHCIVHGTQVNSFVNIDICKQNNTISASKLSVDVLGWQIKMVHKHLSPGCQENHK